MASRTKPVPTAERGRAKVAAQRLLDAGLRRTSARLAALDVLMASKHPMSHADIEAKLAHDIDRVTLYRVLDSLVEAGLVQREVGEDRVGRFVLFDGVDHAEHSHFKCDDCGRVYCLEVKAPRMPELPPGFALEGATLNLHGHCQSCVNEGGAKRGR